MAIVKGCHLVGSVPFADCAAVFRQCEAGMPGRLKRIPDGETGSRSYFTVWQTNVLSKSPAIMAEFKNNQPLPDRTVTDAEIEAAMAQLTSGAPLDTGYGLAAIESYAIFKDLRDEGVIPAGTRFMVCVPTTPSVLAPFVQKPFQARVEPIYEEALFRALREIQQAIPHHDLAFQIDLAADTAFWEGIEIYRPWFHGDVKTYMVDYTARMIGQIEQDVEVGLHNCYGDMEHRHWMEPSSLAVVVERALRIMDTSPHPLNFFHCPVPKSALDNLDAYLQPLQDLLPKLTEHKTELFLGVVHYDDLPATRKMIEAAGKVVPEFGVATECGWGRTPLDQLENIMRISTEVSQPVL